MGVFQQLNVEKPSSKRIKDTFRATRLGKQSNNAARPIRLTLTSDLKRQIMQKTSLLKEDENTKNVYINHDLTITQSRAAYLFRQSQKKEMVEEEDVGNSEIGSGGTEISGNQAGEATQSSDTQLKERKNPSTRRSVTFNKMYITMH